MKEVYMEQGEGMSTTPPRMQGSTPSIHLLPLLVAKLRWDLTAKSVHTEDVESQKRKQQPEGCQQRQPSRLDPSQQARWLHRGLWHEQRTPQATLGRAPFKLWAMLLRCGDLLVQSSDVSGERLWDLGCCPGAAPVLLLHARPGLEYHGFGLPSQVAGDRGFCYRGISMNTDHTRYQMDVLFFRDEFEQDVGQVVWRYGWPSVRLLDPAMRLMKQIRSEDSMTSSILLMASSHYLYIGDASCLPLREPRTRLYA